MKITIGIIVVFILSSCGRLEEASLRREFKSIEHYRIKVTKSFISEADTVIRQLNYLKCFDEKGRLINESNRRFYYYDKLDRIDKVVELYKRAENPIVKFRKYIYEYDSSGQLICILNLENKSDTIECFDYDLHGNLIQKDNGFRNERYYYKNGQLIKKVLNEGDVITRISEFLYDSTGCLQMENWIFGNNRRMKTSFEYYANGKLFREIDSSLNVSENSNSYVEFMEEYHYDEADSISEIIKLARVKSENEFRYNGKIRFEYKKSP